MLLHASTKSAKRRNALSRTSSWPKPLSSRRKRLSLPNRRSISLRRDQALLKGATDRTVLVTPRLQNVRPWLAPRACPPTYFPIVRGSTIDGHGRSAGDTRQPNQA